MKLYFAIEVPEGDDAEAIREGLNADPYDFREHVSRYLHGRCLATLETLAEKGRLAMKARLLAARGELEIGRGGEP